MFRTNVVVGAVCVALLLACAKPTYLPRDEIIEASINYLEQGRMALEEGSLHKGRFQELRDRAQNLREQGYDSEAARQDQRAQEERSKAIAQYAFALEQIRLSERINVRPRTFFLYGQLYYDLGDYDRALEYFDLGLTQAPNFEQAQRVRDQVANLVEGIRQGLAQPPEVWTEPVHKLASLGPVSPEELAPAMAADLPVPTVRPVARVETPEIEPLEDGGRQRKDDRAGPTPTRGPAMDPIPVTAREVTPTPTRTPRPTRTPTPEKVAMGDEQDVTTIDEPEDEGLVPEPMPEPVIENADYERGLDLLGQARSADASQDSARALRLYEQAAEQMREARKEDPALAANAQVAYNLGNAYLGMGQLDAAIAEYNRALDMNPDYGKAYNNMGLAYARGGHTNSALQAFERAIETSGVLDAHYNAGMLYIKRNDIDRAIEHLEAYVEADPGSVFGQQAEQQLIQLRRRM